jgi:hypothetical protein
MEEDFQWMTTSIGRGLPIDDKLQWKTTPMEDDLQWKTTSKYINWNISVTTVWIVTYFLGEIRGKQRGNLVWLCSAQLVLCLL